jgi:hypothetical protein
MESVEEKKTMFNCNKRLDHDGGCLSTDLKYCKTLQKLDRATAQ